MDETENFKNVFGPQENYPYFNQAKAFPFRPKSTTIEMVNAAWCADASLLVYVKNAEFVKNELKEKAGLEAECVGFGGHRVQYFIAHNEKFVLVSFRGTEINEREDVLDDAQWYLSDSKQGGNVHTGFKKSLDSVWEKRCQTWLSLLTSQSLFS